MMVKMRKVYLAYGFFVVVMVDKVFVCVVVVVDKVSVFVAVFVDNKSVFAAVIECCFGGTVVLDDLVVVVYLSCNLCVVVIFLQ